MDTKRFLAMAGAYAVLTFAIAATWHLVLFQDLYAELAIFTRKEPLIPLGLASIAMQAVVLAWLYARFYSGGPPAREGLVFGLVIGVLMASIAVFAEAGKQQVTSLATWLAFESAYYLLQFAIAGLVLGVLHGRGRAGAPA